LQVTENQGLQIAFDRRWLSEREIPEKLKQLGQRIAIWAMGVGPWYHLRVPDRQDALLATIDHFAPLWVRSAPKTAKSKRINLPRYLKWLKKNGNESERFALEISTRISAEGLVNQLRCLDAGLDRLGVVPIHDVGAALAPAQLHRRPSVVGDPAWLFLFQRDFVEARRRLRLEES
jgi:hypothetical protein